MKDQEGGQQGFLQGKQAMLFGLRPEKEAEQGR